MIAREFYTANWPSDYDRIGTVVCSLLNSSGGNVIIGMTDDEHPIGVDPTTEQISTVNDFLRRNISPSPCVMFTAREVEKKRIFEIEVPIGKNGPYFFNGRVYLIKNDKIGYASAEMVRDLVLRSNAVPLRWEECLSVAEVETDVDIESIREDFAKIAKILPEAAQAKDVQEMLACYGVLHDCRLTNAGDVLFGRRPDKRSPQVRIRAFCYRTDKSDDHFLDSKIIAGPLFSVIREAEQFIARNTHAPQDFTESTLVRDSQTAYPPEVIREALVNAVAHRDYSSVSGGVAIHIFPNRIEIWNSGDLPDGVSVGDLGRGQVSVLRNPTIAYALHLRGFMEQAGRGSVLMCQQCEEIGMPRPEWKAPKGRGVTVVFNRISQSYRDDSIDVRILDTIRRHPGINREKISNLVKVSVPTVSRAIRELKERALVIRRGGPRYGGYYVKT